MQLSYFISIVLAIDITQCSSWVARTNGIVCYSVVSFTDPWDVAQKVCNSRDQTLIEILSEKENEAVLSLLVSKNIVDSWLGAYQSNETWRWLDGNYNYCSLVILLILCGNTTS